MRPDNANLLSLRCMEEEDEEKKLLHQGRCCCSNRKMYILSCKIQRQFRTNFLVRWNRQEKLKPFLGDS